MWGDFAAAAKLNEFSCGKKSNISRKSKSIN